MSKPSSRMVVARSTRPQSRQRQRRKSRPIDRFVALISGIGISVWLAYLIAVGHWGQTTVHLALGAATVIAVAIWLKIKFRNRHHESAEENLATLERVALSIATDRYHAVSARNSALRQAREIIVLRAAIANEAALLSKQGK